MPRLPLFPGWGSRRKFVVLALLADLLVGLAVLVWAFAQPASAQTPPADAAAAEAPLPGLLAVLADLRRGGYVVYMRHGITDTSHGGEGGDLARCETQRNLSEAGRAQEANVGRGIRALRVPIGKVFASPYCRTKDTATLALGRYEVSNDLFFALGAPADERQRLAGVLREMLATAPAAGTNTFIVSHNANLREATGIWPKPEGVAYVFKPLGNGRFEIVAKVMPDDWSTVAVAAGLKP